MIEPVLSIKLDGHRREFAPGETLRGTCRANGLRPEEVSALEISVLWHTEGKGDEELSVHYFDRHLADPDKPLAPEDQRRFHTQLPKSPLSYDGVIVKIRWCVRFRVFLHTGQELSEEQPFRLGQVLVADEVPL